MTMLARFGLVSSDGSGFVRLVRYSLISRPRYLNNSSGAAGALVILAFAFATVGCDGTKPPSHGPTITTEAPEAGSTADITTPPGNAAADASGDAATPTETAAARAVTLRLLDADGLRKLIERHRGKIVVVDIWSTTCPPCIKEFPGLVKLHGKFDAQQLACVSVSLDYLGAKNHPPESYREPVLAFLRDQQATFDNVLATEPADAMLDHLDLAAPPAVYVYQRDGTLAKRFDNEQATSASEAFSYEDVERLVSQLLNRQSAR